MSLGSPTSEPLLEPPGSKSADGGWMPPQLVRDSQWRHDAALASLTPPLIETHDLGGGSRLAGIVKNYQLPIRYE